MKEFIMHRRSLWIVVLAALLVSAIAMADLPCHGTESTSVEINASDLDLSAYSGMFTLYQRLQDAAMNVCHPGGERKVLPIYGLADGGDCYSDTLKLALDAYNNSFLNAIHEDILYPPIIVGFD